MQDLVWPMQHNLTIHDSRHNYHDFDHDTTSAVTARIKEKNKVNKLFPFSYTNVDIISQETATLDKTMNIYRNFV